ncbi:MAG: cache domain-containing protein [Atribacterota bacterium]
MKRNAVMGTILICLMLVWSGVGWSEVMKPQYKETEELMTLVQKAAALIEKEGEKVFPDFEKKGSEWFLGDRYLFALDMKGIRLICPPDPSTDGINILDLRDVDGRPLFQQMINEVSGEKTEGWSHYQWPKPGETEPHWKDTYVKKVKTPSGNDIVIGSGLYDMKMDTLFVVDLVEDATALIARIGREAFPIFHDKTSHYLFRDAYIVVFNNRGINQVLPYEPKKEGTSFYDYKDDTGMLVIQAFIQTAKDHPGGGWVEYRWPKPGETGQSPKISFVKGVTVNGETFVVGCGIYPEKQ